MDSFIAESFTPYVTQFRDWLWNWLINNQLDRFLGPNWDQYLDRERFLDGIFREGGIIQVLYKVYTSIKRERFRIGSGEHLDTLFEQMHLHAPVEVHPLLFQVYGTDPIWKWMPLFHGIHKYYDVILNSGDTELLKLHQKFSKAILLWVYLNMVPLFMKGKRLHTQITNCRSSSPFLEYAPEYCPTCFRETAKLVAVQECRVKLGNQHTLRCLFCNQEEDICKCPATECYQCKQHGFPNHKLLCHISG